jgi:hypothetical protein
MRQRYEVTAPAPGENRNVATSERVDLAGFPVIPTGAGSSKVAVTDLVPSIVSEQSPVPAQVSPDQPVNAEPVTGVAESVTGVPVRKLAEVNEFVVPAVVVTETLPPPVPLPVTVSTSVVNRPQSEVTSPEIPAIVSLAGVNLLRPVPSRFAL